jgi:hypothetical protein
VFVTAAREDVEVVDHRRDLDRIESGDGPGEAGQVDQHHDEGAFLEARRGRVSTSSHFGLLSSCACLVRG